MVQLVDRPETRYIPSGNVMALEQARSWLLGALADVCAARDMLIAHRPRDARRLAKAALNKATHGAVAIPKL